MGESKMNQMHNVIILFEIWLVRLGTIVKFAGTAGLDMLQKGLYFSGILSQNILSAFLSIPMTGPWVPGVLPQLSSFREPCSGIPLSTAFPTG